MKWGILFFLLLLPAAFCLHEYNPGGNEQPSDYNSGKYGTGQGIAPYSYDPKQSVQPINSVNYVFPTQNNLNLVGDGNIKITVNKKTSSILLSLATDLNLSGFDTNNALFLEGHPASYFYPASNPNGYISSYTETDPLSLHTADRNNFASQSAASIADINNLLPYLKLTGGTVKGDINVVGAVRSNYFDLNVTTIKRITDTFATTDPLWDLQNGATISGGNLTLVNENSTATYNGISPVIGRIYLLSVNNIVWGTSQNTFTVLFGGAAFQSTKSSGATSISSMVTATSTQKLYFSGDNDDTWGGVSFGDVNVTEYLGTITSSSGVVETPNSFKSGTTYVSQTDINNTNLSMWYVYNTVKFRFFQKSNTDGTISSNINAQDAIDDTSKIAIKLSLDPNAGRMALQIAPSGTTNWTNNWYAPFYVKQSGNIYFNVIDTAKVGRSIWGMIQTADDGRSILQARGDINFSNGSLTVGNGKDMNKSLGIGDANIQGTLYANVVQANTFVDTTPAFSGTSKQALTSITAIKNKVSAGNVEIDHNSLPAFAKKEIALKEIYEDGNECYTLPDTDACANNEQKNIQDCADLGFALDYCFNIEKQKDCKITKQVCVPIKKERTVGYQDTRDIGAMVTLLTESIKELQKQNEDLNNAITKICANSPLSCR